MMTHPIIPNAKHMAWPRPGIHPKQIVQTSKATMAVFQIFFSLDWYNIAIPAIPAAQKLTYKK